MFDEEEPSRHRLKSTRRSNPSSNHIPDCAAATDSAIPQVKAAFAISSSLGTAGGELVASVSGEKVTAKHVPSGLMMGCGKREGSTSSTALLCSSNAPCISSPAMRQDWGPVLQPLDRSLDAAMSPVLRIGAAIMMSAAMAAPPAPRACQRGDAVACDCSLLFIWKAGGGYLL